MYGGNKSSVTMQLGLSIDSLIIMLPMYVSCGCMYARLWLCVGCGCVCCVVAVVCYVAAVTPTCCGMPVMPAVSRLGWCSCRACVGS